MERPWFKNYESDVPRTLDYPNVTMEQILKERARQSPDRTATIFGAPVPLLGRLDAKLTYQQLDQLVDRFAAGLQTLGLRKGDRLALYLPNCPQYLIGYFGAMRAGAIVVPCNPLYVARELEHQLSDSGATVALCLSSFYPLLKSVRASTRVQHVVVTRIKEYFPPLLAFIFGLTREKKEGHIVGIEGDPRTYWLQDLLEEAPDQPKAVQINLDDTCCLLYTGGTTGVPKGAQLSHRNLVSNNWQAQRWFKFAEDGSETTLTALPLYHSYAMTTCMNNTILIGGAQILVPNPRDLPSLLTAIQAHKPTIFPGVPALYTAIKNYPEVNKYDLSSIRTCVSGASGLPSELQESFERQTGGSLIEGYGLTEASPITHCNQPGKGKIGYIGLPLPDTDCKIVDLDTGEQELPPNEIGELCIRGPQVMKGYWNMPTETANALRDGWLYTGDIARMDEGGYFQIVDRKKDMILAASGLNVYPREVEEVLLEHPKIRDAAVIGLPVGPQDVRVKAYIVLEPGQSVTREEIVAFCRQNLAPYKVPKVIEFRDDLPKTFIGKIMRRVLREEELGHDAQEETKADKD